MNQLKQILENPDNSIIGHNIKFDIKILEREYGIKHKCKLYDTAIMHSMIDENSMDNSLKALACIYTNLGHYEDNLDAKNLKKEPLDKVFAYNSLDSIVPLKLFEKFLPELQHQGMIPIFNFVTEMLSIFVEIERTGVYINQDKLVFLLQNNINQVKEIGLKYPKLKLTSTKDLAQILYKNLKLPVLQYTKKAKQPSVDKNALYELRSKLLETEIILDEELHTLQLQFINDILDFRKATKSVEQLTNIAANLFNNRVYTTYNLGRNFDEAAEKERGTVTGRLSSNNPNLQNIKTESEVREIFEVSPDYTYFGCADYSQIELRWAAFLSREPNLINAFKAGKDVHTHQLCEIQGWNYNEVQETLKNEVTSHPKYNDYHDYRLVVKRVNFGILYGSEEDTMAKVLRQMGVSLPLEKVKDIIRNWKENNPVLMQWIRNQEDFIIRNGYYPTMFGRRRHLNGGNRSSGAGLRVLRQGINYPIQSAASDTLQLGIYNLYHTFKQQDLELGAKDYSRILMNVHDEVNFETKIEDKEEIKSICKTAMIDDVLHLMKTKFGIEFDIPLEIDVHIGECWKK